MRYRPLGATGLQVSEIGLGCEGFVGKDEAFGRSLFELALSQGVNCLDLYSPDPALRSFLGRMLREREEPFILQAHLCTSWKMGQYQATRDPIEVAASFEDLLARLEMDAVDIGMIHYVDSPAVWREIARGEVMRYALAQKAAGRIRHLGLSSHNPEAAQIAVDSGLIDVLMFSVNPCYDLLPGGEECAALWAEESYAAPLLNMDPARQRLYESCQRRGIGLTVMKAFGGGDLLSEHSPAGRALTVNQCLHYALTRPGAATVFVGARNEEELKRSLAYGQASEAERDYASALAALPKISWQGHCMYCGHCAPCPVGIDVATVTKFLHLAEAQGEIPETVREHYGALASKAGSCIACGACEGRCPFGVLVRDNMRRAAALFGR